MAAFNTDVFRSLEDFEIIPNIKPLGAGMNGIVYLVKEKATGKLYAAKVSKENKIYLGKEQEKLMREVVILKTVHHPAILDYGGFNLYDFEKIAHPTIITEYLECGSLEEMISKEKLNKAPKNWNSTKKQIVLIGVASAMRYLHHRNITHRDLKPANILLDKNLYPKVCDFGLAKALDPQKELSNTMNVGTPYYTAPEVLDSADNATYTCMVDVYSFGIMMWVLITGLVPYSDHFKKVTLPYQFYEYVRQNGRPTFENTNVRPEIREFIKACWNYSPDSRKTFDQIYEELIYNKDFMIDDNVDLNEVSQYVEQLEKIEDTKAGKIPLHMDKESISFEFFDDEKGDEEECAQTHSNILNKIGNRKFQHEIFEDIKARGFLIKDRDIVLCILDQFRAEIVNDLKFLIEVTNFANNNNKLKNMFAQKLLFDLYESYIVKEGETVISEASMHTKDELRRVNIPPGVEVIGQNAFKNKNTLGRVNIPLSVKTIENNCFSGCKNLDFVSLGPKITEVPVEAFKDCTKLVMVALPEGLKIIRRGAFENCTNLLEIDIPASVELIEGKAFKGCKALRGAKIRIHSKKTKCEKNAFGVWVKPTYV